MLARSRDLLVGCFLLFALAACGQGEAPRNTQSAAAPAPVATVETIAATPIPTEVAATPTNLPTDVPTEVPTEVPTVESVKTPPPSPVGAAVEVTPTVESSEQISATTVLTISSSSTVTVTDAPSNSIATSATAESVSSTSAVVVDPALVAAGLDAYHKYYCGVCHTQDKAATKGNFGPPHNGLAERVAGYFADGTYKGAAQTPAEYVHESLVDPQIFIVPGYAATSHRMPNYSYLDEATLNALVAFLLAP